jgi:hypothetical protein
LKERDQRNQLVEDEEEKLNNSVDRKPRNREVSTAG